MGSSKSVPLLSNKILLPFLSLGFAFLACVPQGGKEERIKKSAELHAHDDSTAKNTTANAVVAGEDCEKKKAELQLGEDHDHDEGHEGDEADDAKKVEEPTKTDKCKKATVSKATTGKEKVNTDDHDHKESEHE